MTENIGCILIEKSEYIELQDRDHFLSCLEQAGVDNWQGWDDAVDIYNKDKEED